MSLKRAEQLADSSARQGASGRRGPIVRGLFARFLRDTSSSATIEYGFIVAGIALAVVLVLEEIGADGRIAARALFRFRIQ
jgi:Flp pilus assembly pilin Flp